MEYRRLGNSGLKVSALSFGSWVTFSHQLDTSHARELMAAAFDQGVNFFDNAEAYAHGESERIMGQALQELRWDRDAYIVSSKVMFGRLPNPAPTQKGLSRKHIMEACHQALKRLRLEYLDLYFCHRPDPDTPISETVHAMDTLIRQGKILYWGTSEWSATELMEAYRIADQRNLCPPTMEQPQYNLLHRRRVEQEYAPLYEKGLGTTVWSPLASGLLTGKYNDGMPAGTRVSLPGYEWLRELFTSDEGKLKVEVVRKICSVASEAGLTPARLALAWCLKNPCVSTVILGATTLTQLQENLHAIQDVQVLNKQHMDALHHLTKDLA